MKFSRTINKDKLSASIDRLAKSKQQTFELPPNVHAFELPDKSHLSYCFPNDIRRYPKQGLYKNSYLTPRLINHKAKRKENQIRIGGCTSRGNQALLFADFDKLPSGFATWDGFYTFAKNTWPDALWIRTFSRKVKGIFCIDSGYKNSTKNLRYYLLTLIGRRFFGDLDTCRMGMTVCFIEGRNANKLSKWLNKLPTATPVITPMNEQDHTFKRFRGQLPAFLDEFITNGRGEGRKTRGRLSRILLRQIGLCKDGFDLPVTKLSEELKVCTGTVSRLLNELSNLGMLELISDRYAVGFKAKTYKVANTLLEFMLDTYKHLTTGEIPMDVELPSSIESGSWHETIWKLSKYFINNCDEFYRYVENLPNCTKDRYKKAIYAIKSRTRYFALDNT